MHTCKPRTYLNLNKQYTNTQTQQTEFVNLYVLVLFDF